MAAPLSPLPRRHRSSAIPQSFFPYSGRILSLLPGTADFLAAIIRIHPGKAGTDQITVQGPTVVFDNGNQPPVRIIGHRPDQNFFAQDAFSCQGFGFTGKRLIIFRAVYPVQTNFNNFPAGTEQERIAINYFYDRTVKGFTGQNRSNNKRQQGSNYYNNFSIHNPQNQGRDTLYRMHSALYWRRYYNELRNKEKPALIFSIV